MYNASPGIYAPVPVRLRSQPIIDWPTNYETRARPSSIISECNECIMDADSKLRPISTNLFDFGRILIHIYRVSCDLRPFNYPYGERRPDFGKRRCLSRVLRKRKKEGADYSRSRDGRKKSFEFCEEFCDGTGERVAERVPSINRYACDSTPASQPTLIPEYSRQERENDARHRLKREGLPLLV